MEPGIARARLDFDTAERFLPLRRQLGVTAFGLNQLVLQPGQRGRIHRHAMQEEVYRGPGRLVLLALGGSGEHAGRDGEAFAAWEDEHGVSPQQLPLPDDLPPGERAG